jgi:diguanylate cyclase (GGDEF)-like protein
VLHCRADANVNAQTPPSGQSAAGSTEPAADTAPSLLTRVEETLRDGFPLMRFPAPLEQRYRDDRFDGRKREALSGGLAALVLFDLLLAADVFTIPDALNFAVWLKLGVVTPLALMVLLTLDRLPGPRFLDPVLSLFPLLACATQLVLLDKSHAPLVTLAYAGLALLPIMVNTLLRLHFWYAVAVSTAVCALYAGVLAVKAIVPLPVLAAGEVILLLCSVGTLFGNRAREYNERREYLQTLRRHLRVAADVKASTGDGLEGIHDRRSFSAHLEQRWFDCRNHELPISLLLIQADEGAEPSHLQSIASIVKSGVRHASDLAAHLGGARFALTLPALAQNKAVEEAQRLRSAVENLQIPLRGGRSGDVVTISIGVAVSIGDLPGSPHALIDVTEDALGRAQSAGGNRVECGADPAVQRAAS